MLANLYSYHAEAVTQLQNLAVGEGTKNYLDKILKGAGEILAYIGGSFLILVGLWILIKAWSKESKDLKMMGWGLATMVVGGAIIALKATGVLNLGNNIGRDWGITS